MWDCVKCGCRRVAASLLRCPVCREERDDMPKTTTGGGSNGWEPQEGAPEPGAPEADAEAAPEPVAAAPEPPQAPVTPEPAPAAKAASEPAKPAPPNITGTGSLALPKMAGGSGNG